MSLDPFIQSLTWHAHVIAPCLVPPPEQPSTAVPGCVENLPKEIAVIIIQKVFAQSKKDYGALVQTCKTVCGPFNGHFFEKMKRFPLYKTLLRCSEGDDTKVGAAFRRALNMEEGCPVFFRKKELELELFDTSTKESLRSACARFPNCTRLSIVDKRTPVPPQTVPEHLLKWLFHVDLHEPEKQSKESCITVAAAVHELPKLRELHLNYQRTRPLSPWQIISRIGRGASMTSFPNLKDNYISASIALLPADDPTLIPGEEE